MVKKMKTEYILIPLAIVGAMVLLARKPEIKKSKEIKKVTNPTPTRTYAGIEKFEQYYAKRLPYYVKYYK